VNAVLIKYVIHVKKSRTYMCTTHTHTQNLKRKKKQTYLLKRWLSTFNLL